jgi:hypothetical protein
MTFLGYSATTPSVSSHPITIVDSEVYEVNFFKDMSKEEKPTLVGGVPNKFYF